jgi:hypothetical protein
MNMKKVLAAGIAATLAVSSFAAVASAEELPWKMGTTVGTLTYQPKTTASKDVKIVTPELMFKKVPAAAPDPEMAAKDFGVKAVEIDINGNGILYDDMDAFIPFIIDGNNANLVDAAGNVEVTIKGQKYANGGLIAVSRTVKLVNNGVKTATEDKRLIKTINGVATPDSGLFYLPIYAGQSEYNAFDPAEYNCIDEIIVTAAGAKTVDVKVYSQAEYDGLKTIADAGYEDGAAKLYINGDAPAFTAGVEGEARIRLYNTGLAKAYCEVAKDGANIIGVAPTGVGANVTAKESDPDSLFNEFVKIFGDGITINWRLKEKKTEIVYPFLPKTTRNEDSVIDRWEVWELSTTKDYASSVFKDQAGYQYTDTNQSYNQDVKATFYTEREGLGDRPTGFGGFASQVADYFNKSLNGKITFVFTLGAAGGAGTAWETGGIPSTEIGLKKIAGDWKGSDFALFFNYGSTTGSLQADTLLNTGDGRVTFDISHILDALGGQTIGTIQDVYYGLGTGINYTGINRAGLLVEQVIFEKDVADVDAGTDEEPDEEPDDEIDDEPEDIDDEPEDIDDEPEDIDDEPEDIDDEPEDIDDEPADVDDEPADVDDEPDATVDDEPTTPVVVEEPTDGNQTPVVVAGEDENPGTGVALAVVPMLVAAAAAVVSKKRK